MRGTPRREGRRPYGVSTLQMSSKHCPTACVMRTSPWRLRSHVAVSSPRPNTLRIREQILASSQLRAQSKGRQGAQPSAQSRALHAAA